MSYNSCLWMNHTFNSLLLHLNKSAAAEVSVDMTAVEVLVDMIAAGVSYVDDTAAETVAHVVVSKNQMDVASGQM